MLYNVMKSIYTERQYLKGPRYMNEFFKIKRNFSKLRKCLKSNAYVFCVVVLWFESFAASLFFLVLLHSACVPTSQNEIQNL